MTHESTDLFPVRHTPETRAVIIARGQKSMPVGCEFHEPHHLVVGNPVEQFAAIELEKEHLLPMSCRELLAIGRQLDAEHSLANTVELLHFLARSDVP